MFFAGREMKTVMKKTTCAECGSDATVTEKNYRTLQFGIPVELQGIEVIECSGCGESPVIPHLNELMEGLALVVLCKPCTLTGADVRFLRKFVNKSARDFSRYLNYEHTTLSKVENDKRAVDPSLDKLVRLTVAGLEPKMRGELDKMMELMPNIRARCEGDIVEEILGNPATGIYEYALLARA